MYLKALVSPSQPGVGRVDYHAWLAVSETSILTVYCTCPTGAGWSCNHVAAIAYSVIMAWEHTVAGETCTDRERYLGKGSNKVLSVHEELLTLWPVTWNLNILKVTKWQTYTSFLITGSRSSEFLKIGWEDICGKKSLSTTVGVQRDYVEYSVICSVDNYNWETSSVTWLSRHWCHGFIYAIMLTL